MKRKNWTQVDPASGKSRTLPAGGYSLRIIDVKDNASAEAIEITWDVADGEHAGTFGDAWGEKNAWAHRCNVYYGEKSEGYFRHFLDCIEASNSSFRIAEWEPISNEMAFIGKLIGVSFGEVNKVRSHGDKAGKPFKDMGLPSWHSVQDVREGRFNVSEPAYRLQDEMNGKWKEVSKEEFDMVVNMYKSMSGTVKPAPAATDDDVPF